MARYYEDLEVGSVTQSDLTYLVTAEEIMEVGRRWDPQPFHTDPELAKDSVFGGLVAATVHLLGMLTSLGVKGDPTAAVSALGMTDFINHSPARPGDELHCHNVVTSRRLSNSRPGLGVVSFRNQLINQRDELVFSYEATALIRCRDADDAGAV